MDIKYKCTTCQGTGELTVVDQYGTSSVITCIVCNGEGLIEWGDMADVVNKLDDIKEKVDDIMAKLSE